MEEFAIRKEVEIDATPDQVWPYIGTGTGLGKWFGNATVSMEEKDGGHYEERGSFDNSPYVIAGRVVTIQPPRKLILECRVETSPESTWPVYTTMTFTLEKVNGGTKVTLVHSGFEKLPEAYRENMHTGFTYGWGSSFPRLAEVVQHELVR